MCINKIITHLVIAIDNENSTHLNSDKKVGRKAVIERIPCIPKTELKELLRKPSNEYKLIKIVSEPDKKKNQDEKNHFSFATKFGHYTCKYLFREKEHKKKISRNGFDHYLWYFHKGRR